jgi:hypothetical protein
VVGILQKNKLVGKIKEFALNYPEEGFGQALQSKMPLSITISPPKNGDIQVLIANQGDVGLLSYGIQTVQIQPALSK